MCSANSEHTQAFRVRSVSSDCSDTKSAKKLMVRSTGDGGVSLCSAAFEESDCAVTDCVSHVKRFSLLP